MESRAVAKAQRGALGIDTIRPFQPAVPTTAARTDECRSSAAARVAGGGHHRHAAATRRFLSLMLYVRRAAASPQTPLDRSDLSVDFSARTVVPAAAAAWISPNAGDALNALTADAGGALIRLHHRRSADNPLCCLRRPWRHPRRERRQRCRGATARSRHRARFHGLRTQGQPSERRDARIARARPGHARRRGLTPPPRSLPGHPMATLTRLNGVSCGDAARRCGAGCRAGNGGCFGGVEGRVRWFGVRGRGVRGDGQDVGQVPGVHGVGCLDGQSHDRNAGRGLTRPQGCASGQPKRGWHSSATEHSGEHLEASSRSRPQRTPDPGRPAVPFVGDSPPQGTAIWPANEEALRSHPDGTDAPGDARTAHQRYQPQHSPKAAKPMVGAPPDTTSCDASPGQPSRRACEHTTPSPASRAITPR